MEQSHKIPYNKNNTKVDIEKTRKSFKTLACFLNVIIIIALVMYAWSENYVLNYAADAARGKGTGWDGLSVLFPIIVAAIAAIPIIVLDILSFIKIDVIEQSENPGYMLSKILSLVVTNAILAIGPIATLLVREPQMLQIVTVINMGACIAAFVLLWINLKIRINESTKKTLKALLILPVGLAVLILVGRLVAVNLF